MKKILVEDLYELCNRKRYFTCGSNEQYKKMFELATQGASVNMIAAIIWACSDDHAQLSTIMEQLEEIQEPREEMATLKKDSHAKDENLGEDSPELIELKKKWWD